MERQRKAQLRKVLINRSWEEKLEASVRMRERDRELRASRSRMEPLATSAGGEIADSTTPMHIGRGT